MLAKDEPSRNSHEKDPAWSRQKALLKEAISEWVAENPTEGKEMITGALAAYIDALVKEQLESVGKWTLRSVVALLVAALFWLWLKSGGFKI